MAIRGQALETLSVRPGSQLEVDQHGSGLRRQAAHDMATAHHLHRQIAGTTAVRFVDSGANKVVLSLRRDLTENLEDLWTEPVGTDLALDRVHLATLSHDEVYFPTRLVPPVENSLTTHRSA